MSNEHDIETRAEHAVLGTAFEQQMRTQLREAADVLEHDWPAGIERFRDLLNELIARADGCALTQLTDADQPVSRLSLSTPAATSGEPVSEFLLIPFGEVTVERSASGDSFVFTRQHAESAQRWFDQIGRRLAIDYEHQSFDRFNTRPDGLRPAAGWIGKLEVRDDGLWASDVTWTPRAKELLRSGEYRYFSPVIYWTDEDYNDVAALGPVALTNDPAMHGVPALAASRRTAEPSADNEAALANDDDEFIERAELDAVEAEVAVLRKQLAAQEADTFVERGMRLGKVLDSTSMDWREDYLRDPEQAEERLARSPVLLPPGRVLRVDRDGAVEPLSRAHSEYRRHADVYRRWGIEPEDLAAYEQALAANRVRHFGTVR